MTRRALPFLMVAAAITAVSGCTCNGDVSIFPRVGPNPGGDGGNVIGGDGGQDGGQSIVDPCQIIVCPPPVDGGFSGTIDFPPDGGFNLDGGLGTGGDGVSVDPMGRITLNSQDIQINYAWIANWKMGTVSKFDTKNLLPDGGIHEVGRYISVFPLDGLGRPTHSTAASVYDPSRTAIDINGDMWVANFASHANQYFSVTKIAGSLFNCVDRNGNGKIDTSFDDPTDVANYGVITPNEYLNPSADPTNPLLYDECVLFTQELGNINPNGAFGEGSISIAAAPEGGPGDVWVGTWIDRRVWRLDPFTGVPKPIPAGTNVGSLPDGGGQYIGVPQIEPYGSAVDRKNRLWVVDRVRNNLAVIDANTQTLLSGFITPPSGFSPRSGYGIAVDQQGRVWMPGWGSGPNVTRYDPGNGPIDAGTWTLFSFPTLTSPQGTTPTSPRGVTVDDQGLVWVDSDQRGGTGCCSAALAWGFDGNDGGVYLFNPPGGTPTGLIDATSTWSKTSIGIGLDQDKNLWVNNSSGNVMRIDRNTGGVTTSPNQAGALYTYSDFTGYQLRHITLSQGSFTQTVAGCSRYAEWDTVSWDAITPPNTSVVLFVRGSNNTDFTVSQQYGPFTTSPANLQAAPGPVPQFKYLQLQFLLTSKDGTSQPYLLDFSVSSKCLTPLQ